MYPAGHGRNTGADLRGILDHKFRLLGSLAVKDVPGLVNRLSNVGAKSAAEIASLYDCAIEHKPGYE